MQIEFVKKYNRYNPGDRLSDVFRQDALRLIAEGYAEELEPENPPVFVKHDWAAEKAKQAVIAAAAASTKPAKKESPPSNAKETALPPKE